MQVKQVIFQIDLWEMMIQKQGRLSFSKERLKGLLRSYQKPMTLLIFKVSWLKPTRLSFKQTLAWITKCLPIKRHKAQLEKPKSKHSFREETHEMAH